MMMRTLLTSSFSAACAAVWLAGLKAAAAVPVSVESAATELAPIVFLPGYYGNFLDATIATVEAVPNSCIGVVPVGVTFALTDNSTMMDDNSACANDLLTVQFDAKKVPKFYTLPGVVISVRDFGGFDGIGTNYHSFVKNLHDWGYSVRKNAFGAPYDFRLMSSESLAGAGFIHDMQQLVETAYQHNDGRRVVLVGHSNGGPTIYSFVTAMTNSWRDTYIAGIVGLSGNFLGQMNFVTSFIDTTSPASLMMSTWESNYMSLSWGGYSGVSDIPIVISHPPSHSDSVNYTTKVTDLSALFSLLGRSDWVSKLQAASASMDRSSHPQVNTYCFYGQKLPTSYAFEFAGDVVSGAPFKAYSMDGDGDQDIVDQQFCENVWGADAVANSKYVTKGQGFDGVQHMDMCTDENVMNALHQVLTTAI
jgi:hypothetical protein